ncbi:MAG: DUF4386 domain-containing protein [Vallitaleaceae bacterium]|jgi:hypothetical protein|nr:DUF4386 domain-containing protein [Vallitaleaceae bacterium]
MNQSITKDYRKNAIAGGTLLLLAIITGILSVAFNVTMDEQNYLSKVAANETSLIISTLLIMAMAFACAGIAISFYPVLKRYSTSLALTSVACRVAEAISFLALTAFTFSILSVSRLYTETTGSEADNLETIGRILNISGDHFGAIMASTAFAVGAFIYYYIFYRTKLIPRWVSIWGMIAMMGYLAAVMAVIFGAESFSALIVVLNLPTLGNELFLGVWLIVKGFDQKAIHAIA